MPENICPPMILFTFDVSGLTTTLQSDLFMLSLKYSLPGQVSDLVGINLHSCGVEISVPYYFVSEKRSEGY